MKPAVRRLLLLLPLLVLILVAGAYVLLDAWLESSGGRDALGKALAARIGMPVELDEEFDIVLFPSIGVSGKGFRIGGKLEAEPFLAGGEYELAVALRPLMDRRVVVETARLTGATVYPERFERRQPPPRGQDGSEIAIPEIRRIIFENVSIVFPDLEIPLKKIAFTGFAPGHETPFAIESDGLGLIEGGLLLDPEAGKAESEFSWSGHELGAAEFAVNFDLNEAAGMLDVLLSPAGWNDRIRLRAALMYRSEGLYLDVLNVDTASQALAGSGCLLRGPPVLAQFDLQADSLDLDPLEPLLPVGGEPGAGKLPDLRLRLRVKELRGRGVTAHEAELRVGAAPDCGESGMPAGAKAIQ